MRWIWKQGVDCNLFFSYTRTAIQTTMGVYGERCWLSVLIFADRRFENLKLVNCCF